MAATMICKSFAGTSLRQAVPTTGKVRGVLPIRCLDHITPITSYGARGERGYLGSILSCTSAEERLAIRRAPL